METECRKTDCGEAGSDTECHSCFMLRTCRESREASGRAYGRYGVAPFSEPFHPFTSQEAKDLYEKTGRCS